MILFTDNEVLVVIGFIGSILFIVGGLIFRKLSKPNETVKRNISFGICLWGIVATFINAPMVWRIMNGTFEFEPEASDVTLDYLNGVVDYLDDVTHRFVDHSLLYMVMTAIGILMMTTGLVYKKKKWAKVAVLIGIFGLLQFFLHRIMY